MLLFFVSSAVAGEPVKKTVKAGDGLTIACDVRGKGDTALVFLHGWGGDRDVPCVTALQKPLWP